MSENSSDQYKRGLITFREAVRPYIERAQKELQKENKGRANNLSHIVKIENLGENCMFAWSEFQAIINYIKNQPVEAIDLESLTGRAKSLADYLILTSEQSMPKRQGEENEVPLELYDTKNFLDWIKNKLTPILATVQNTSASVAERQQWLKEDIEILLN